MIKEISRSIAIWIRDMLFSFSSFWLETFCGMALGKVNFRDEIIKFAQKPDIIVSIMVLAFVSSIDLKKEIVLIDSQEPESEESEKRIGFLKKLVSWWDGVNRKLIIIELIYCTVCYSQEPTYLVQSNLMGMFVVLAVVMTLCKSIIIVYYNRKIQKK